MATRRRSSVMGGAPGAQMGARRQSVGGRRASAVAPEMAGSMASMLAGQSDLHTFNLFDGLLNESLRQSYFLGPDSYFMFWSCLTDEKLAIQFVTQLIISVVEIDKLIEADKVPKKDAKKDKKDKKDKKSKDAIAQAIAVPLEEVAEELFGGPSEHPDSMNASMKAARAALMSTIVFIATHFDIKASSASKDDREMFDAIEAWKKRCAQAKVSGRNEKASHLYSQFAASFVEDKASFSNDVDLMEALDAAVHVHNAQGLVCPFQMPSDIVNNNLGPAFSWHFVMRLCAEGDKKRQEVFAALMDMLRVHNTEPRLLCLLHIFTELLHSFSPWDTDQLRRLIPTLELFFFWPCPFGPLAQALAGLVERELSCPGAAMRDRVTAEVPHVTDTCESGEDQEAYYRVPMILEQDTANTGFLKWVIHDEVVKSGRPSSRSAMIWFLNDLIRCSCAEPLSQESLGALSYDVPLKEITPLYEEACRIDIAAQEAAEQDAATILERMKDLKKELESKHGTNSPSGMIASTDCATPRARMRAPSSSVRPMVRRESVRRTSVTLGMAARGARRSSTAPMGMPDLLASTDLDKSDDQLTMGADQLQLRVHFQAFDLDCSNSDYTFPAAPATFMRSTLREIISSGQYMTGARRGLVDANRALKLCLAGSSRALHAYVCALVELKQSTDAVDIALVETLSSCPLSLYLLPMGNSPIDNVMGEFIARADGWYAKHILTGLSAPLPMVPQLRDVKAPLMTVPPFNNKPGVLSPLSATRTFVERYVREASNEFVVKLFVCECWGEAGGSVACSIPFCESVEIGQTVCTRYQKCTSRGPRTPRLLFGESSSFRFTFVRMGLTGETTMEAIDTPPKAVQSALISNVGRRDTTTAAADPTKPWLELDVDEHPSVKDACLWNEHVGTVDVDLVPSAMQSPSAGGGGRGRHSDKFHIFVDGQPYGPFSKIRCSALLGADGETQECFNIRTFFPLMST